MLCLIAWHRITNNPVRNHGKPVPLFNNPSHVLITGASSGIGAALAIAYAAPGRRLSLGGRDIARLNEVTATCRAAGAHCEWHQADVTDQQGITAWLEEADAAQALDLVIANAGISGGTRKRGTRPMSATRKFLPPMSAA